jgi:hypothetical protein
MIPKILHFCFGLSPKGGDWGLAHYACVKSAVHRIKPKQAFLYFEYTPNGPFWELTTKIVECRQITAPRSIFGNPLLHYAHRADVVRLQKLLSTGGIYLDCDVFVHRDFDNLLGGSAVVMGREESYGLCNAVVLAEPGATFLRRWYDEYRSFRSKGHDQYWGEHSVIVPQKLALAHPDELTILGPEAFFRPSWKKDDLMSIFESSEPVSDTEAYANHLWESHTWLAYLRDLTPGYVRAKDSNFHSWVRPLIADLPDDFGARSIIARARSNISMFVGSDHLRKSSRELYHRTRSRVRRAVPIIRYRRQPLDKVVAAGAAFAKAGSRPNDNFIARLHRRRTFQAIYRDRLWAAEDEGPYFSGVGSRGNLADAYVEAIAPLLRLVDQTIGPPVVVDLGCGDFGIGKKLTQTINEIRYIGCDIVPELIAYNQYNFGLQNVEFKTIDIVSDNLPDGDVCLIRQVFQHLSNREISAVLPKLSKYKNVYVSEAQPINREGPPNPDKPAGAGVRFDWKTGRGRGVELDQPPWDLKLTEIARTKSPGSVMEILVTHRLLTFAPATQRPGTTDTACASGR